MEDKFTRYTSYDFAGDERWQNTLKNIYPMPPVARLDKTRRKWYKTNVDKDFDVDYKQGTFNDPNSEYTP